VHIAATLGPTLITTSAFEGLAADGDAVQLNGGAKVAGNFGGGVLGSNGSSIGIVNGAIVDVNIGAGVLLQGGSTLFVQNQVVISGNTGDGITILDTGVATFGDPNQGKVQIINNGGFGVTCELAPAVAQTTGLSFHTVTGNTLGGTNCPGS
jgi:hypothetical protein